MWPAFEWMGANPVVPALEEGAPLDDVPDSLFNFDKRLTNGLQTAYGIGEGSSN